MKISKEKVKKKGISGEANDIYIVPKSTNGSRAHYSVEPTWH